VKNDMMVVWC